MFEVFEENSLMKFISVMPARDRSKGIKNKNILKINKKLLRRKKVFSFTNHSFYKMPKNRSLEINDLTEAKMIESIIKSKINKWK